MVIYKRLSAMHDALNKNNVFEIKELIEAHLDELENELINTRSDLILSDFIKSDHTIKMTLLAGLIGFIIGVIFAILMPPIQI